MPDLFVDYGIVVTPVLPGVYDVRRLPSPLHRAQDGRGAVVKHFYARHRVDLYRHVVECNCGWRDVSVPRYTHQKTYEDIKRELQLHIYNHRER